MADNKEFYRLDLVIGTDGIEETEKSVKAMDKLLEQTQRRAAALGRTKINPTVDLVDKTTSPTTKVISRMNKVGRTVAKPEARLVDRVSSATNKIGSTLTGLTRKTWRITVGVKNLAVGALSGIKNTMFSLPSALAAGGAAYGGVIAPLNLAGQMEQANIAFETMLGSATKAKSFITDLQDFANKTPFEFPELRDSSKRLLAFGFEVNRVIPMMTAVGNASSGLGLGSEGVDRITIALGQMRAKQKLSAEEMMQLTEAGIPAWDILAQKMKISTAEVMKLSSKGVIPADKAIDALIEGMNKRFPNMMDKQSKSLLGIFSNLKDVFSTKLLMKWGDGIRSSIQPRLLKLAEWFDKNESTVQRWGDTLQKAGGRAADWVALKFEKVMRLFDDPTFQDADLFGKVKIAWDTIITQPLSEWWSSGGEEKIKDMSGKIGTALGGGMKGFILGALGLFDKNELGDESVYVSAGRTAGEAFFTSFLEALDPDKITSKIGNFVLDKNTQAFTDPSLGNTAGAVATNLAAFAGMKWLYDKFFKTPVKVGGKVTKWLGGRTKTATGALAGAATASASASASGELSRVATYGTRGSGLARFDPKYKTPIKTQVVPKSFSLPGIPAAAKFLKFMAPVAVGVDAYSIATAQEGEMRNKAIGSSVGGWSGALAGSQAGGLAGSIVPGPGTVIGAVGGGIAGAMGGSKLGETVVQAHYEKVEDRKLEKGASAVISMFDKIEKYEKTNPGEPLFGRGVMTGPSNPTSSTTEQVIQIPPDKVSAVVSNPEFKQEVKNNINVTVPAGAVQINFPTDTIDYSEVANKVGWQVADLLRRNMQNIKTN